MLSEVPIYRQLKTAIIRGILTGELKQGGRLPSVRQLGCDLGINLHTVNKVYNMLKEEGYIIVHRNQGAIVAVPPDASKEDLADFAKALFPIVIEMRARNIAKTQLDELVDTIWEQSIYREDITMNNDIYFIVGILGLSWILVVLVSSFIPFYIRKNIAFGVSVPESEYHSKFFTKLRRRYLKACLIFGGVLAMGSSLTCIWVSAITVMWIHLATILVYLVFTAILYLVFYYRVCANISKTVIGRLKKHLLLCL